MIEKTTFKEMLASLPQANDVKTMLAVDASGNPVSITKESQAQVAAELMPVATVDKKGLMSADKARSLRYYSPNITTDNKNTYVRIEFSTKCCFILAFTLNTSAASLFFVSTDNGKIAVKQIAGNKINLYESKYALLVDNRASWSNFSLLLFTGEISKMQAVEPTVPEGFTPITVE